MSLTIKDSALAQQTLKTTLESGEHIPHHIASGLAYQSTLTFARSANTTTYAAGSVIGTATSALHELTNIGSAGGHVMLSDLLLLIYRDTLPSGMSTFRLHLYDAQPDARADGAAWDLASAGDRSKYLTYIDIDIPLDLGSTLCVTMADVNRRVKLADGSTSLWAQLQTIGSFTPASGTTKRLVLGAFGA